ncbi:hypothetical protein QFC20_004635 [Naganishia adeliensis]|uniref:Uncharacterized protein n=1 Tax=Naganishia adeliensis TaxID=92952 RepID=A0ACC2VXW3_9TREE|nr:hypothetical protein QFC20_004635 [Naganishia adeliensis]
MMSTFRSGARLVGTLVRYGSLISLLVAAVGWITGGQQGAQGGGLANILGGLAGNNNNNNGNGGMANGLFNMAKNYATGQGQQQGAGNGVWDQAQGLFANVMEGQQQQQPKNGAKYNTRANKQRAAAGSSKKAPASNGAAADGDLSDIAQGWVKDALLKATGLDSLFGGDAAAKPNDKGKKEGRAAAR